MKLNFIIFTILLYASSSFGQTRLITGKVKDQQSNTPLAGVTVVLLSKANEKLLSGTATNESGEFEIKSSSKEKSVILRLSFIGYETRQIDSLTFREGKSDLGEIKMRTSAIMTSAVEIKGQRPMVEYHIDKQVINMEKVPGSQSGSVTDALKNTGIVEVDPSTNKLSVRGNSNVNILIDGKPQAMADDLLSQMPATYVDKVEVITTPSAKDDPEGDGGTINIITKKNKMDNYNGSVSLYSSTQEVGFGSLVVNYRKNKLNIFSSVNGYFGHLDRNSNGQRLNYQSTSLHSQLYESQRTMKGYMGEAKLGFDYDFDSLNAFSLTGNYDKTNGKIINNSQNRIFNINDIQTYTYSLDDDGRGDFNNYTVTANYKRKINTKGHELSADAFYSDLINSMKDLLTTEYDYNPFYPGLQNNINDIKNRTLILNSDYVNPTEKYGKFEAGYKFTLRDRKASLDYSTFSYLSNLYNDSLGYSNTFKYKENINALYFAYTNNISVIEYKLGLRLEHTYTDGEQVTTGETFSTDYNSLFPSLGLSYKFNDLFQLAFNAARKINRPQMDMINPFIRVNGPNNITRGNPKLEPTYVNSYELKFNPILNVYYNTSKGRPTGISTNILDSITVNTTINSALTKNYGFELTIPIINEPRFPIKFPEWFQMFNIRIAFNRFIEDGGYLTENYSIKRTNWKFTGNFGLKLWEDINAMFYYNITPKSQDERYHNGSTALLGMLISKDFMDKKLQISLNINDILNNMRPVNETYGSNFYSYNKTEYVKNQNIGISIRYNFNDFQNRQEKTIDDGRDKSENGMFK
ncbi:MAG: TonB-dependent receptor [Bacteroidota bacterium]|nr:TonB-dependent receptor [Bacteroidota bacterium]MDP4196428.1 TonB-dependent receptor [Bacteroidota bacterium]